MGERGSSVCYLTVAQSAGALSGGLVRTLPTCARGCSCLRVYQEVLVTPVLNCEPGAHSH